MIRRSRLKTLMYLRFISIMLLTSIGASLVAAEMSETGAVSRFHFHAEEIDRSLKVGYAVLLADVNHDGKRDIVVVDTRRVIWFENPSSSPPLGKGGKQGGWRMRTIIDGQTEPDNVCIDAYDIDGDGLLDLALGAGWRPFNTMSGGSVQWLKRGATLDELWSVHPIDSEPTIHRLRFADLNADGKSELIVAPLFGKGSTRGKNYSEAGVRLLAYKIPEDPVRDRWVPEVIEDSLHVMHNFHLCKLEGRQGTDVLTASFEGVNLLGRSDDGTWNRRHIGVGNQDKPESSRGASEVKLGRLQNGDQFIASIEPWHGNEVVVYFPSADANAPWNRQVIDDQLKWGHAVWCADLDADDSEELIIGVRDNLNKDVRSGVRIYKNVGSQWERHLVDPGGVAVEDLAVADLNGDGKPDIVAVGRATGNVKIYWNESM